MKHESSIKANGTDLSYLKSDGEEERGKLERRDGEVEAEERDRGKEGGKMERAREEGEREVEEEGER